MGAARGVAEAMGAARGAAKVGKVGDKEAAKGRVV
jgi:hypothetical protein